MKYHHYPSTTRVSLQPSSLLLLLTIWNFTILVMPTSRSNDEDLNHDVKESATTRATDSPRFQASSAAQTRSSMVNVTSMDMTFRVLHFTTPDINACHSDGGTREFNATWGDITIAGAGDETQVWRRNRRICDVIVSVPEDHVVHFSIQAELYMRTWVHVCDKKRGQFLRKIRVYSELAVDYESTYSYSNVVKFHLYLIVTRDTRMVIRFEAVPLSDRPKLVLLEETPHQGYVQTPTYEDGEPYSLNMDSWIRVTGPVNRVTLISLHHLDLAGTCSGHWVTLYRDNLAGRKPSKYDVIWKACGKLRPVTERLDANGFHVHFRSVYYPNGHSSKGFRLWFYFINPSLAPAKLAGGGWRCSVPDFEDYRRDLFPCNLRSDCEGGEDEVGCPYYSNACAKGLIFLDGFCYKVMFPTKRVSWKQATSRCLGFGSRLPVLGTPALWTNFKNLLVRYLDQFTTPLIPVGMKTSPPGLPSYYRKTYQWWDGTIAYNSPYATHIVVRLPACLHLKQVRYAFKDCVLELNISSLLCQLSSNVSGRTTWSGLAELGNNTKLTQFDRRFTPCSKGHVSHSFLACDVMSACWVKGQVVTSDCGAPLSPLPPMFPCSSGSQLVPYTLVCDHRQDCMDLSDERFCRFLTCSVPDQFACGDGQCIHTDERCNGVVDCLNGYDEINGCDIKRGIDRSVEKPLVSPPARVDFEKNGEYSVTPMDKGATNPGTFSCPQTHFLCPSSGYCLPVYCLCNGVSDCTGHEDEVDCDSYECPGLFRCRQSSVCLHQEHICDDINQCPQREDELLCSFMCPTWCTCYGLSLFCSRMFSVTGLTNVRFIDAPNTGMTVGHFEGLVMLVSLNLQQCNITVIDKVTFPNLHFLNLSKNQLTFLSNDNFSALHVPNLRELVLSDNPLVQPLVDLAHMNLTLLERLDLSKISMTQLDLKILNPLTSLKEINVSHAGIEKISKVGFSSFTNLRMLDLRGCPVHSFFSDVFQDLAHLQYVFAENYRICCADILPVGFNIHNCQAPSDESTSCRDLLPSGLYRYLLAVLASLILFGNLGGFVFRMLMDTQNAKLGFNVFVTHLCLSDFFMGVYLAMIGVADLWYRGTYLWRDTVWKTSAMCKLCGILSLMSCEVSALIICLITVDRCLVLRFPFSHVHFRPSSAHVACLFSWIVGLCVALVPVLPQASHWRFYSQTGICIPLPITRQISAAHEYSFAVIIVFNFVMCSLIAGGQIFIYHSVNTNTITGSVASVRKSNDHNIARRLVAVAMSNFICWFPIGCLGFAASRGLSISSETNVAMAVFVLPLNSAINPSLYTLNLLLEKRRMAKEERLYKCILQHRARISERQAHNDKDI